MMMTVNCMTLIARVALVTIALSPSGDGSMWRPTNPGGGGAFNSPVLSVSKNNPFWAVGSDLGGVYLSLDIGISWTALGASFGLTATHVASMVAHPNGYLLVGTDSGLYMSTIIVQNNTPTLTQVYTSHDNNAYISAIGVSANDSVVYAAVHPNYNRREPYIIRSQNGGKSWSNTSSDLPKILRVTAIRTHPVDSEAIWVVAGEGRFNVPKKKEEDPPLPYPKRAYYSDNGGVTFNRRDPMVGDLIDIVYAYDPTNLDRMYATSILSDKSGKFFISEETGFSWVDNVVVGNVEEPTGSSYQI
jgi:hypothetical protein